MNAQEIFDTVAQHLLTQNEKSVMKPQINSQGVKAFSCAYRGINNTKCAFGILITDEEYRPEMETNTSSHCIETFPSLSRYLEHIDLLNDLQIIHDSYEVSQWSEKLQALASEYHLQFKF